MINAAITIIYRPKTMFHRVQPHGWTTMGSLVRFSHLPSLYPLESAVSTFHPPPHQPSNNTQCSYPRRATRRTAGFMQKSHRMSPWGATTRLINRGRDAPSTPTTRHRLVLSLRPLIGKLDGFSTCEIGGLL